MSMHSLLAWSNIFAPLSRLQCRLDFGGGAFLPNSNQSNSVTMVNQWNSTLTELFTFLCRFHILTPVGEWRFFSLEKTFLASPNIALTLWEDYVLWIISNMTKTHHGRFVSVLGGSQMFSWFSTQFSHEWEPVMRTGSYIYIWRTRQVLSWNLHPILRVLLPVDVIMLFLLFFTFGATLLTWWSN